MTDLTPDAPRQRRLSTGSFWILLAVSVCTGSGAFVLVDAVRDGALQSPWYPQDSTVDLLAGAPGSPDDWRTPIPPLPKPRGLDPRRVALGGRLFHDAALSSDYTISCASCHDLAAGGDDGRVRSIGVGGAEGTINAPTVFNAAFNFRQFWDGRAATLEEQVDGPIQHPAEMNMTWAEVVERLSGDPGYVAEFVEAYGEEPDVESIRDAIATFERSLVTVDSPFDRFLRGAEDALSPEAKRGWKLFQAVGCVTCHQGVNAGGSIFQTFGSVRNYFEGREDLTEADLGRFNVTGDEQDRHRFKVPTLRNIELTAPYFHDGHAFTLPEAVQSMALHQLGKTLEERDLLALVSFLNSLTGKLPESALVHGQRE